MRVRCCVWARRKEGRSGRVWMEELGWTSVFLTNFDAIPRSLADWRDVGYEFFLRLMSSRRFGVDDGRNW